MRWAVLATAILVIVFLMAPLAQFGAVEANPFSFRPGLYVYSPGSNHYVIDPMVSIYFYYSMENNLTQISFSYSLDNKANSTLGASMGKSDYVYYYTVSKTLEGLADGDHTLTVYAHCSNGTVNSIINSVITVDAIAYTPVIISPLNQTTYNITQVPLTYAIDEEILWSYYSLDSPDDSDLRSFNGNITLSSLSEGQHELRLYVTANLAPEINPMYEQPRYHTTAQTIVFYIDTAAPKVTNLSVNGADSGDVLLGFTVDTETSWVGYSLDNQANVTVDGDAVLKDLAAGSHNVTVYAEDTAGNTAASETFYFTIAEPFPVVPVAAASVISFAVLSAALLFHFKKRKH
jgi:hypothetical protein